jgi:GTP-binding protein Era
VLSPKCPTRVGRIALVGRPNVGKSTLLNAMVGERLAITSHHPQTTRDRIVGVRTEPGAQFVFVDTPGIHTPKTRLGTFMNKEAKGAILGADVLVFVTDVRKTLALSVAEGDLPLLAGLTAGLRDGTPVVLALNKVDRVKDKSALLPLLEAYEKLMDFAALVPLSAKRDGASPATPERGRHLGAGPRHLLDALRPLLPEGDKTFDDETLSDRPSRFFVAEFVREQILDKTRAEVPHGVAVRVERFDESGKVAKIDLAIFVDKESHKKIVIGHRGALLKAIGTQARFRVEKLLGQRVHLSLWVRVEPRWYESAAHMVELGYASELQAPLASRIASAPEDDGPVEGSP